MSRGDWSWISEEAKNRWGFTVSELASWLGVKRQVVDNWLRGRNDPDIINVFKLARLVGSIEELASRAGLEIEFSPPDVIQFNPPMQSPNDRDYEHLRSVAEWMKYTSRFKELYEQSYRLLRDSSNIDNTLNAQHLFNLAYADLMLGRPSNAIQSLNKAKKVLTEEGSLLLGDIYWFTGECYRVVNKLNIAQFQLEKARKIYQHLNAKPTFLFSGPLWLEWDLGRLYAAYGEYDKAADYFTRMGKLAREIWLAEGDIIATWSFGDIDEMRSNFKAALPAYFNAKQLANQVGDKFWEAMALWRIAEVYRKTRTIIDAVQVAENALQIFKDIGNERMIAKVECTIASCNLQMGLLEEACKGYYKVVEVFKRNEDIQMEHAALLGFDYVRLCKESRRTVPNFKEVLPAFEDIILRRPESYDPYQAVCEDLGLAEALRLAGHPDQALSRFHAIVRTSIKYGYQLEKAHALLGIAATKFFTGEADREGCNEALKIYEKLGSIWGRIQCFLLLGFIKLEEGESGSVYLEEALKLARNIALTAETKLIEKPGFGKTTVLRQHVFLFI
jgi:tetratricopeptide (TPR) repeat protein